MNEKKTYKEMYGDEKLTSVRSMAFDGFVKILNEIEKFSTHELVSICHVSLFRAEAAMRLVDDMKKNPAAFFNMFWSSIQRSHVDRTGEMIMNFLTEPGRTSEDVTSIITKSIIELYLIDEFDR